jgi:HTH-type transcriptional regulator / antitoxin HigA
MEPKILESDKDYQEAIQTLEILGDDQEFDSNPEIVNKFKLLELLISIYEKKHFPIEEGNPIEIIKLKMEFMGLKQKDLIPFIGTKSLVSEVLNNKRKLSKKMIRELSKYLGVSQELLNPVSDQTNFCIAEPLPFTSKRPNAYPFKLTPELSELCINFQNNLCNRGSFVNMLI